MLDLTLAVPGSDHGKVPLFMTDSKATMEQEIHDRKPFSRILGHRVVKFLLIGGLSFVIDLGLLILLHEFFGVGLWIATPISFIASLVFNFALQRSFTFKATNRSIESLIKYVLLVIFNIFATDIIVNLFAGTELTYATGKVVSTVSTMVWNFFIYKYWIFPSRDPAEHSEKHRVEEAA